MHDQVRQLAGGAGTFVHQILGQHVRLEIGPARCGVPLARTGTVAQIEAARVLDLLVEVFEVGDGVGDQVADASVIPHQPVPVHRMAAQRGGRDAGQNRRLRTHLVRQRFQLAVGGVDHAERVFDRDRLRTFSLAVDIGPAQARQDQRVFTVGQMAAVELGADLHGQVAIAQRLEGAWAVGGGLGEVAAQGDEHFRPTFGHGMDRLDHVVAVFTRYLELEAAFQ
ncbi:hypothetical protein D3C71_751710 [compost metagenome]